MTSTSASRMLPLYEAKLVHHYDHRWATYEPDGSVRDATLAEKQDPSFVAMPRYWVREQVAADRLHKASAGSDSTIGLRDIARSTDERTVIGSLVPMACAGNNLSLILGVDEPGRLIAVLSSLVLDFVARLKVGGVHLNFFIANQLPVLAPSAFEAPCAWDSSFDVGLWVDVRVAELTTDWDVDRRAVLRAELDAAMFHLYGVDDRDDVDYILGTFRIVNRKDVAAFGEERTRRLVLENHDAMADAARTGRPFVSTLDPPPGQGARHPAAEHQVGSGPSDQEMTDG